MGRKRRGGPATTGLGLVSILLWLWATRQFLWEQSCYRNLRIGLSGPRMGAVLCAAYRLHFTAEETEVQELSGRAREGTKVCGMSSHRTGCHIITGDICSKRGKESTQSYGSLGEKCNLEE